MTIYGFEGQDVTLPCKYNSRYHGICDICWMRGTIPTSGCGAQIIYANEKEVVKRSDARYQLNGALQKGDASLTILSAKKTDSGTYGCRVHVPGLFNDKKIVVYLGIREGPVLTTQNDISTVPEHVTTKPTETQWTSSTPGCVTTTTHIATHGPVSTTQDETTTGPEHVTTKHTVVISENYPDAPSSEDDKPVNEDTDALPAILVPVILILLVLGISVVYLMTKHKRSFRTTLEIAKNSSTSVSYSNLDSSVTLITSSNN
ncbi:hypothetical protein PDJAM_G00098980 [Pangasius djambal]|uniref:Uncharacterized protein n=1 Tax=Pangasius djambal TaxID=1691987 RepID=A0ACC5Z9L4_9TELE|nr:hypothetical protein [Pangasius djambal]